MILEIPVLIETIHRENENGGIGGKLFQFRPVFFEQPTVSNKNLDDGLQDMSKKLHEYLRFQVQMEDIEEIVKCSFAPEMMLRRSDLVLDLPRRFVRISLPVIEFESEDRRIGFCPLLTAPPFEFVGPNDFYHRGEEVYRNFFRQIRKEHGEPALNDMLKPLETRRHFRLSYVECSVDSPKAQRKRHESDRRRELLESGREELEQTGLCLDKLYPKKLDGAVCRDDISERIYRLLTDEQRQAVLIVGPPKVGKTAVIHSVVAMMVRRLKRPRHDPRRREVWQLTPGRLIAGMLQSGQWETRLNGIFAYAEEKDLTLNFSQLVALLNTGKSAQGNLSMADMLLPALRRRRFRVVAEMTEEQLRIFRERNRPLADQFEIVHLVEPEPEDTMRILLHAAREYEWHWKCSFDADLFPLLIDLTRQYEPESSMPGKAVHWLGSLAMQFQGEVVDRSRFLEAFREKTGLRLSFFDGGKTEAPEEIDAWFERRIIGQRRAIASMRDVIILAESLMTDPDRPMASLFFPGPTGVGKTECAKQLARYFFGSEDRLLRFDANELCTSAAVARMVGSHQGGEGLLTGAVRRQPFSVILFDEIEKGHPDLFDLLLQVIGEARLTDTQGRVASFSQSIVVFTSNLGSRRVSGRLGFEQWENINHDSTWLKAIRDFFKPEFVNRIDRIVPFDFLSQEELQRIAARMIDDIMSREGLQRRHARLLLTPETLRRITCRDVNPVFGARGMRRALQRDLVAPLSRFLASTDSRNPSVIEVTDNDHGLNIQGYELRNAEEPTEGIPLEPARLEGFSREKRREILTATKPILAELHEAILPLRPSGRFDAASIAEMTGTQRLYFRLQDEYTELRQQLDEILEQEQIARQRISTNLPSRLTANETKKGIDFRSGFLKRLAADVDLKSALDDLFADRRNENNDDRFPAFLHRIARLFEAVRAVEQGPQRAVLLTLRAGTDVGFDDAAEENLLEETWQRRILDFPSSEEIPGWETKEVVRCLGFGALNFGQKSTGSTLIFHDDRMSVLARLVLDAPNSDEDLRRLVLEKLRSPTEKWPPVIRIVRHNNGKIETADLFPRRFSLPNSLRDLLPSHELRSGTAPQTST